MENTAPPDPRELPVQFMSGLELYERLKIFHKTLEEKYERLITARRQFLSGLGRAQAEAHAFACQSYVRSLLCFTQPAQGRLPALLGIDCSEALSEVLLLDFLLQTTHFQNEISRRNPPANGAEVRFLTKMTEYLKGYIQTVYAKSSDSSDLKSIFAAVNSYDFTNPHCALEKELLEAHERFKATKNKVVKELIEHSGWMSRRRDFLPETGVLVCKAESAGAASSLSYVSHFQSFLPMYGESYSSNVRDYLNQFGAEVIVALDKLDSTRLPHLKEEWLKIYMEIQAFVAKTSSRAAPPEIVRRDSCLSPVFFVDYDNIFAVFTDSPASKKNSQRNSCNYLKDVNSASAFYDYARSESSLELMTESQIRDSELNLNLYLYLESLILKIVVSFTEEAVVKCLERRETTIDNPALMLLFPTLKSVIERLSGEETPKCEEGEAEGDSMFYNSLAKYFLLTVCVHFTELPTGDFGELYFSKMRVIIEKLCFLPKQSDLKAGETSTFVTLIEKLAVGLLTVMRHFTSTNCHRKFLSFFWDAKLPMLMDAVLHHISEKASAELAILLKGIILNVKFQRVQLDRSGNECTPDLCFHHVGPGFSVAFVDAYDPKVCEVSMFVSLLLSLYTCFDSEESALVCIDELSQAGLCCCMTSHFVLEKLLPNLESKKPAVVERTLDFIKQTMIPSLDGLALVNGTLCLECQTTRVVKAQQPPEELRKDGVVFVKLSTAKDSRIIELYDTNKVVRQLANESSLDYMDLKWAGLSHYKTAMSCSLNPSFHEHFLYLSRFARFEIKLYLFENIYRDFVERTLKTSFCSQANLNKQENIYALSSSFTALTFLLLTTESFKLTLTDAQWLAWKNIFFGNSKTRSVMLARASYGFGCALICGLVPNIVVPSMPEVPARHKECFKAVEGIALGSQTTFLNMLHEDDMSEDSAFLEALDRQLMTWSVLAELSTVPVFMNYLEKRFLKTGTSLVPFVVLTEMLQVFNNPMHKRQLVLLKRRLSDTCALIRCLLTVVAASDSLGKDKRPWVVTRIGELLLKREILILPPVIMSRILSSFLDVTYDSIIKATSGVVDLVCGRTADRPLLPDDKDAASESQEPDLASISSTSEVLDILPQILHSATLSQEHEAEVLLLPDLVPMILQTTIQHHNVIAFKLKLNRDLQQLSTTPVEGAGIVAKAFESWFGDSCEPEAAPKERLVQESDYTSAAHSNCLERVLEKTLFMCRQSRVVSESMLGAKRNLKLLLLSGFSSILEDSANYQGVASLVLKLWEHLASEFLTAAELKHFLALFMGPNPPMDSLLRCLSSLLEKDMEVPRTMLTFGSFTSGDPLLVSPPHDGKVWTVYDQHGIRRQDADSMPENGLISKSDKLSENEKSFLERRAYAIEMGYLNSGLTRCRVACVFSASETDWTPVKDSTTAAFWFKVQQDKEPGQITDLSTLGGTEENAIQIHLFSFGVRKMMVSAFLNSLTGACHVELSSYESPDDPCQTRLIFQLDWSALLDTKWHFVTFSLPEHNTKKPAAIAVESSIDGIVQKKPFQMKAFGSMKPDSLFVLLGNRNVIPKASDSATGRRVAIDSYLMTNFMLFSCPRLDELKILLLMAHGKNATDFLNRNKEETGDFVKEFLTPELVSLLRRKQESSPDKTVAEALGGLVQNALSPILPSMVFQYNSCAPERFLCYARTSTSAHESRCSYNSAAGRSCLMFDELLYATHSLKAHHALLQLGGASTLLRLLARVVELNNVEYSEIPRAVYGQDNSITHFGQADSGTYMPIDGHFGELSFSKHSGSECGPRAESATCTNDASLADKTIGSSSSSSSVRCGASKSHAWCQAEAVKILLLCVKRIPEICKQFHSMNGIELLMRLLYSPKMDTRLEVLKVLVENCVSDPVLTLDRSSAAMSAVSNLPVHGVFRKLGPQSLLIDARFLAAILTHWHRVELKKLEIRQTDSLSSDSRLPERLVVDWCYGCCHSIDVLHRVLALLCHPTQNKLSSFNAWQLHRVHTLHLLLNMAQELLVMDWSEMQVTPRVLQAALLCFVPPHRESNSQLPNWPVGTVSELLNYLVLRVEPCKALVWHSESCTARLLKIYSSSSKLAESSKAQRIIRNILEIDLAEEVTKEITSQFPKLDSSLVAQEGKGLLTKEDQDRLSSANSSFEAIDIIPDCSENAETVALSREVVQNTAAAVSNLEKESPVVSASPSSFAGAKQSTPSKSVTILSSPKQEDDSGHEKPDQISDAESKAKTQAGHDGQKTSADADGPEISHQTCASNYSSTEEEQTALRSAGPGSTGTAASGRSTPLFSPPPAAPNIKLDAVDGHFIAALHDFLLVQEEKKFTDYITECVKPNHLALLANHGSVVVRTNVMKIFRQILCRRAPALRNLNIFKDQLMIVHHQFACKDSSDDLLEACLNLVISKPGHSVDSSEFVLITGNMRNELKNPFLHNHILDTSAPLLAVLPKIDGLSFDTVDKVLAFLSAVVEVGTCNRGKLLSMDNLPESLLLTLQSFLKESRFRSVPVSNIIIDLCRSLLLQGDDLIAAKGLDLITKLFLLSENSNGKTRTAAVDVLGRTLINCVVCLLRAMIVVSSKSFTKSLVSLRLAKKREKNLVAEEADHRSLELFADIKSEYEDYLLPVSPELATAIEAVNPNQTSFVLRTIRVLKMTSNFLLKLDWVGCANSFNGALYHGLPLFLLDLQKKLLVLWDDVTSHSGRMGFTSTKLLPSHQLEILSREYELEMRSALPELLCLIVAPSAPVSLFSDVLRRLARDPRAMRTIFMYCRDRANQMFSVMGHYLSRKSKILQPGSQAFCDCDRVTSAYEAVGRPSLYRDDTKISNPEGAMTEHLQHRLYLANHAVSMDVKMCVAAAVREHEDHRKKISMVYNKFLIMHANLKKLVLDEIARSNRSYHDMTERWLKLGSDAFNDQSPWCGNAPSWWELLDYENYDKSRSLLGRTLLKVHPKFLVKEARAPLNLPDEEDYNPEEHQPLSSVLDDGTNLLHGSKANFFASDAAEGAVDIKITCKGWIVKPGVDWPGTILVADGIYFRGVKTVSSYGKKLDVKVESSLYISPEEITKVRKINYRLRPVAFEVHLSSRKSWLFVCDSEGDRDAIATNLTSAANIAPEDLQKLALKKVGEGWESRSISNFDYILALNFIAGRTYNDLNQYPVFPYVLANYSSETLDITDPKFYRDLSKPMPVQTPDRENYFAERFERSEDMSPDRTKFHYSSLYSNCVVVPNYLVRLPPFTLNFLHFQGGKFDEPTRTFKNLEQTYKNITQDTYGDFKEAIPEMYYLPEMFCNGERFNLGALSDGTLVDHVLLPKWCRGDRRIFVLCHRAALESAHVTNNLPSWIDLIFGFKQTGEGAVSALNVYHPQGYRENLKKERTRAWEEAISMYGEVPTQLFPNREHSYANPVMHIPRDKLQMQFPHNTRLTKLPVKGLQLHCFGFFPIRNNAFDADPGIKCIRLEENFEPVMSGEVKRVFSVAPRGAVVIFDRRMEVHVLQPCGADGVARVWSPRHIYPYPLFSLPSLLTVTCQTYEDGQLWLGTDCGLVLLYNVALDPPYNPDVAVAREPIPGQPETVYSLVLKSSYELPGTQQEVTALWACSRYNICVSADAGGSCCVWDIRQPVLLRTVACFDTPVTCVGVSNTTGDWVVATDLPKLQTTGPGDFDRAQSRLHMYSVNGVVAAKADCPALVRKFAFTSHIEGRSVNVIAAISNTLTRNVVLYSSWDLTQLHSVHADATLIKSLKWSSDCSDLLVYFEDRRCKVYQSRLALASKALPAVIKVVDPPTDCARAFK